MVSAINLGHGQPIYSLNAVGYVDVNLHAGSNLVANPLNAASNTVGYLFGQVPDGSVFLPWNQATGTFGPTNHYSRVTGWSDSDAVFVQPNGGFLVVTSATKISFHGIPWSITHGPPCVVYPFGESVSGWFRPEIIFDGFCPPGYPDGTTIITWDPVHQRYDDATTYFGGFGWVPYEPNIGPGMAFRLEAPSVFYAPGFLGLIDQSLMHGRPFQQLRDLQRNGPLLTFRLAMTNDTGYSLLSTTNLSAGVWEIVEQGTAIATNGFATFTASASERLAFYKVHPRYSGFSPVLFSRARVGNSFSFDFYAPTTTLYRIERMTTSAWETVTNLAAASNTLVTVIDGAATGPTGQYRVAY